MLKKILGKNNVIGDFVIKVSQEFPKMKKYPKVHRHGRKWRIKFSFSKQKYVITADSEQECIELYQQKIQPCRVDCVHHFNHLGG